MKNYSYISMAEPRYYTGAYILASMLKEMGCQYPLSLYVTDIGAVPDKLKKVAAVHEYHRRSDIMEERSRLLLSLDFEKVFWLGCDCYPAVNIDYMFDDCEYGVFWREVSLGGYFEPSAFGLDESARHTSFQVQGDTLVFNLKSSRAALELAHQFNVEQSALIGKHGFQSDQATYRAAWCRAGIKQFSYSDLPVNNSFFPFIYLHQGKEGYAIIHRLGSKWPLMFNQAPSYLPRLPHEAHVWNLYRDFTGSQAFLWQR